MLSAAIFVLGSLAASQQKATLHFNQLEKVFKQSSTPVLQTLLQREDIQKDLRTLHRIWITQKRFELLSEKYKNPNLSVYEIFKPDLYYHLSRHSYILGHLDEALGWAQKISDSPENKLFFEKAVYVQGAVFLKKGDIKQAVSFFSKAAAKEADTTSPMIASKIALARIAFDQGRYGDAQKIYSEIPKNSSFYEDSLQESAWTDVKLEKFNRASTSLDLLFTLYPQSRRLPEAGYLLGNVIETLSGLSKKAETLDRLVTRLSFEQDSAKRASELYSGREENILSEIDPMLPKLRLRTILSPIARTLLQSNPVVRTYVANFQDLQDDIDQLEEGKLAAEAINLVLDEPDATTADELLFMEWANDVEQDLVGKVSYPTIFVETTNKKKREVEKELASLRKEQNTLMEIDQNININWLALAGEREKQAVEIKNNARLHHEETLGTESSLIALVMKLDAVALKNKKRKLLEEEDHLLHMRKADDPASVAFFQRLDQFRSQFKEKFKNEIPLLRVQIQKNIPEIKTALQAAQQVRDKLILRAREDLRKVLHENEEEVSSILKKYRWVVADARYQLLRATEKEMTEVRNRTSLETASLEDRYQGLDSRESLGVFSSLPHVTSPLAQERMNDIDYFRTKAKEFTSEIEEQVSEKIEKDRQRFKKHHDKEEGRILDIQARSREEAIFAHTLYLKDDPNSSKTPFGLYRLAQLHFERAEAEAKLAKSDEQAQGIKRYNFDLAISPLLRIQKEFPSFVHRDLSLYLLGYALLENEREGESIQAFERLVSEFPQSRLASEVYLRIGEHYFKERKYVQAISAYQKVLTYGFNFFYDKALYKLAWSNYLLGKYDSAIAHFLILLDYSAVLSSEDRARFVEFADEATEYLAFSIYRAGGSASAKKVFEKTGWKPYALPILLRMGTIATDRGDRKQASEIYFLAFSQFPLAPELPDILEHRIRIFEELKQNALGTAEMETAYQIFRRDSAWWGANKSNSEALAHADSLMQKVLFNLGTLYETKKSLAKAEDLYKELQNRFPKSEEAYEANYRLGEMAYAKGDYSQAIAYYDELSKNDRFSKHFSDSLFGIVVCREKLFAQKGEVAPKAPEFTNLISAIENFSKKCPKDPRVAEAIYRIGSLQEKSGNFEDAQRSYSLLAQTSSPSPWKEPAMISWINTSVSQNNWKEVITKSEKILFEEKNLTPNTKSKLRAQLEGAKFKEAESTESEMSFVKFQSEFPESELAPKALYNAFAIAKKKGNYELASASLDSLLKNYPHSPEASSVNFEQALLYDTFFETNEAKKKYSEVLDGSPTKDQKKVAVFNYVQLLRATGKNENDIQQILNVSSRGGADLRPSLEIEAARLATEINQKSKGDKIYAGLLTQAATPLDLRIEAASALATQGWELKETSRAISFEDLVLKMLPKLKNEERIKLGSQVAFALSRHVAHDREVISQFRLRTRTDKELISTFKKKANLVTNIETIVLQTLGLGSRESSASALMDLGMAYHDFIQELEKLPVPKEGKEDFQKTISSLTEPLKKKREEAWVKAYGLIQEGRTPLNFLNDLIFEMKSIGLQVAEISKQVPQYSKNVSLEGSKTDVESKSSEVNSLVSKCKLIWENENYKDTRPLLEKIRALDPANLFAIYHLVVLEIESGNGEKALALAREGLKQNPKSPLTHLAVALAFQAEGKTGLHHLAIQRAYALDNENPRILRELAFTFGKPYELSLRNSLLETASKKGLLEAQNDWAALAFEVQKQREACSEWSASLNKGNFKHPTIVLNEKLCHGGS